MCGDLLDFESLHANLVDWAHGQGSYRANRFRSQDEVTWRTSLRTRSCLASRPRAADCERLQLAGSMSSRPGPVGDLRCALLAAHGQLFVNALRHFLQPDALTSVER